MPSSSLSLLLLFLLLLFLLPHSLGKVVDVRVDTLSSFVYLDRFVFNKLPTGLLGSAATSATLPTNYLDKKNKLGLVKFDITYINGTSPELLMYFADDKGFQSWHDVYSSVQSCAVRRSEARTALDLTRLSSFVQTLSPGKMLAGRPTTRATGYFFFDNLDPKWFFLVLANCAKAIDDRCANQGYCQGPNLALVNLVMTNGNEDFTKHFSYDELGIREVSCFGGGRCC